MSMPGDLVSKILADAGVFSIIGERIYPLIVPEHVFTDPQDRRPCVVYNTSGLNRGKTFCATDDLIREEYSLDCFAETYDAARALGVALVASILDFSGVSGATHIEAVFLESQFDGFEIEPGLFRRNVTLSVWHRSA